MNKTAIKNFAIWARNKLIADIQYRAGLMGITADGIKPALPQSTSETEFYDIGTAEPYAVMGDAIKQRKSLEAAIRTKEAETDYKTAYKYIIEGVAYTWFNRLIAVRFMEVNDYLPSHIRVLSSDSGKVEPDLVTTPFDAELSFTDAEKEEVIRLKQDNKLDECFRLLFIKQCNALNEILPALFEKTSDYTELLLNISAIDMDGVVYHLIHDIPEEDFNIEQGGQVEIIGWLYQYYNTEPKDEAFAKKGKITKEEIPAVTQLFTPDWIVRYMVENSLGRLWVEGHPNDNLKDGWKYYLEEAEQEPEVQAQLDEIHKEYSALNPEDIHFIDPCMGSGHILVYAFDVLMQIYESMGYSQRDAAKSILENNLYGLDIDDRAYQMAYFAVLMKARQYNRRILSADTVCHVYSIQDSIIINRNQLTYFGVGLSDVKKKGALSQIEALLDTFKDAKEYGSILNVENHDWNLLRRFAENYGIQGQMSIDAVGIDDTKEKLLEIIAIGETMARKYEVVVTNPPYMGSGGMPTELSIFVKEKYPLSKTDMSTVFMEKTIYMSGRNGIIAMINIPVWMNNGSFAKFRESIINRNTIINLLHNGRGVFGADFGSAAFTIRHTEPDGHIGVYYRLFRNPGEVGQQEDKSQMLLNDEGKVLAKQSNFKLIPGFPIAYSLSEKSVSLFKKKKVIDYCEQKMRISTGDNDRFIRLWFEVKKDKLFFPNKWVVFSKGGNYRKWYGNRDYVINYENNGKELRAFKGFSGGSDRYYFKPGIVWTDVSISKASFRDLPSGAIACSAGPMIYVDDTDLRRYIEGFLNSLIADSYMRVLCVSVHFQWGDIAKIPLLVSKDKKEEVVGIVEQCISCSMSEWDSFETSWDFKRHPLVPAIDELAEDKEAGE